MMQALASELPSVSRYLPATQFTQATVDAAVYCPAPHAVQDVPPLSASVSVTDPAAHSMQSDAAAPPAARYLPEVHPTHALAAPDVSFQ